MFCRKVEGLVGNRKLCVHAHHAGKHIRIIGECVLDPSFVFENSRTCFVHAVTVGNLITEAGAQAEFFGRIFDGKKGIFDFAKTGVMIEYGGNAVLDGVEIGDSGTLSGIFIGEMTINGPPQTVQDIQESVRIIAVYGKSSGHRRVDMLMRINESRHDDTVFRINKLRLRIGFLHVGRETDVVDEFVLKHNCAVFDVRKSRISGKKSSVSDDNHGFFLSLSTPVRIWREIRLHIHSNTLNYEFQSIYTKIFRHIKKNCKKFLHFRPGAI